ncbi:MAG: hypothetical protein AAGE59_15545 [Cyanobacteria bacterium P01_F01_bin.86]
MLNLTRADWQFCFRWALVTAIAVSIPLLLHQVSFPRMVAIWTVPIWIGIAQGLTLERYWTRSIPWGFTTAMGGVGAFAVAAILRQLVDSINVLADLRGTIFVSLPAIVGVLWGLAQALVLRGTSRWWRWWPGVNVVILHISIVGLVILTVHDGVQQYYASVPPRPWWHWLFYVFLSGLISGFLESLALALFLKQTPRLQAEPKQ